LAAIQSKELAMPEMNSAENLYKCINRKLRPREEQFKRSRGQAVEATLELYYVLDIHRNLIVSHCVELQSLAHEVGALYPWERMER
jgi:hypothetical protein